MQLLRCVAATVMQHSAQAGQLIAAMGGLRHPRERTEARTCSVCRPSSCWKTEACPGGVGRARSRQASSTCSRSGGCSEVVPTASSTAHASASRTSNGAALVPCCASTCATSSDTSSTAHHAQSSFTRYEGTLFPAAPVHVSTCSPPWRAFSAAVPTLSQLLWLTQADTCA